MDPFTQRMLERAKSRREKLDNQKMKFKQKSPLQEKINLNDKVFSNDNMQPNSSDIGNVKKSISAIRKSKLQRLAQLYSGNDENTFFEKEGVNEEENVSCNPEGKSKCRLGRLNELACKIKLWEDDVNEPKHFISGSQRNISESKEESSKRIKTKEKQGIWDSSMVEKLCSQGFSRSESQSKLMYDFKKDKEEQESAKKSKIDLISKNFEVPVTGSGKITPKMESHGNRNEVLKKAAFFESTTRESPKKPVKDPAELSLAERKALFERGKCGVAPKNPLCTKAVEKELPSWISKQKPLDEKKNSFEEKLLSIRDSSIELVRSECISEKSESRSLNEKELIPELPPLPSPPRDSAEVASSIGDKEEEGEEASSPKSGRLYPSLSNLDITEESGMDRSQVGSLNESNNSNLCLNMTLSDLLELNKNNPATPPGERSFSQSKECQVLNKMDRLLEDALNDLSSSGTEEDSDNVNPSPPKMKKSSSFEYKSGHEEGNPLLHTVSFYRKQQQSTCFSTDTRNEEVDAQPEHQEAEEDEGILVQNKIQALVAEVNKQQTIISQASQALNLCLSTVEFSGSGEQVEGERLLLLASHKRQACLNEIQRLKIENTMTPQARNNFLTERGDVNLTNISIKLKRDALRSIAAAENLQYFVCLVKSDEQVLATPAVSATKENLKDMALSFPGQIKVENLSSNFKITVEVYNLELSKELLPHEVKYHIINKKDKKLLTPIKSKKSESRLVKPNIQSPAGPNAVRSSNFQMCGYIVFSLREITRTQWILNRVPYVSPVEGTISITIKSELRLNHEFRGFLTMFDDISGFGAWHRRWCLLSSYFISYWKYPDDEAKKVPIGTIDLRSVVTENVGLVSRDICARLNTFLLETTRPRLPDDKNSLVVSVKDDVTTIRHLLSADSKQEMSTWCRKLNPTLALLRSWKSNSSE